MKKVIRYKGYCIVEATDSPKWFPYIHKTKKAAIEGSTSFFGDSGDDPIKRGGVIGEVEVIVKLPAPPKVTPELIRNIHAGRSVAVVRILGDPKQNRAAERRALAERNRQLKKIGA